MITVLWNWIHAFKSYIIFEKYIQWNDLLTYCIRWWNHNKWGRWGFGAGNTPLDKLLDRDLCFSLAILPEMGKKIYSNFYAIVNGEGTLFNVTNLCRWLSYMVFSVVVLCSLSSPRVHKIHVLIDPAFRLPEEHSRCMVLVPVGGWNPWSLNNGGTDSMSLKIFIL